jgi:hypothetical protein
MSDAFCKVLHRAARVRTAIGWLAIAALMPGCEKYALDRQMDELCKTDGGVKIYETVSLPPEMFDQWGDPFPGWRERPLESRLGPDYRYIVETTYLKSGDPQKGEGRLDKTVTKIVRRSDERVLGVAISYGRSGGDFIAYANPSSRTCPTYKDDEQWVIKSVFVKRDK